MKASVMLRFDSIELSAILPLGSSATYPTYCCRVALGNATLAATHRGAIRGLRHWFEVSVSAPTSHWSNAHASSLAATAALTRDAGYYLPDTTTLRASLGGEVDVTRWLSLGASAGGHYWLRDDPATDALVVPLTVSATLPWAPGWWARASYRSLARPLEPDGRGERGLHALTAAVAHAWSSARLEASVSVPLDDSLRELEMVSLDVALLRSF
jgi:hypothetical protein